MEPPVYRRTSKTRDDDDDARPPRTYRPVSSTRPSQRDGGAAPGADRSSRSYDDDRRRSRSRDAGRRGGSHRGEDHHHRDHRAARARPRSRSRDRSSRRHHGRSPSGDAYRGEPGSSSRAARDAYERRRDDDGRRRDSSYGNPDGSSSRTERRSSRNDDDGGGHHRRSRGADEPSSSRHSGSRSPVASSRHHRRDAGASKDSRRRPETASPAGDDAAAPREASSSGPPTERGGGGASSRSRRDRSLSWSPPPAVRRQMAEARARKEREAREGSTVKTGKFWDGFRWVEHTPASQLPSNPATRKERRLYVGNLPQTFDSEQLRVFLNEALKACGAVPDGLGEVVVSSWVSPDKKFAFVELSTVEAATTALGLSGISCLGCQLKICHPNNYVMGSAQAIALQTAFGVPAVGAVAGLIPASLPGPLPIASAPTGPSGFGPTNGGPATGTTPL